ncbi:MAG TPA: LuxR C-terminal-related transcriptional regulator [Streptosporangiaceae bacterium]|nr:LuxR C-terminal-related transcriptional regulator [Streptosporangiaceae bacterium]
MAMGLQGGAALAPQLRQSLLDAKFTAPQPRPGTVSRAELIETARRSDCRVVGVIAAAGYGKSTFLAEWAQAEDRPVAWVSLDRFDDDPAILLASVAAAYRQAGLGSADLIADMGGRGVSVLGRAAPRLASEFRASPVPFVLMLDDLHELQSPGCHDVLGVLISAIRRGSQLVATSRGEQPHLPRLRASGDALEFGADDLALGAAGAQQIFSLAQVSLTPEMAAAVTKRTEGWPAGLYLAALIAKESDGQEPTVTGDDRYVADYLYREALIQQPEDMQRFLRRTAVLDQLCGPLCDAILGSSGAAEHLRRLEASSLFLIPLDRRRQWYRYHALFREFLLGELRRTEPDIVVTLHQRAAEWYESHGSPALAVEHLLDTAERDRSVRLVTALTGRTYNAGHVSTVQRWLSVIGDTDIERYPPLAVLAGWISVLTGDTAGALRWAALVNAASFDLAPGDGSASFDSARAMLRAVMCASGPEPMMADASFAVAQEPAWSEWRDTALWLLAEAHLLAGRIDEARAVFAESSTTAATLNGTDSIVICESELALLAMDRGEWQEAAGRLELALATIDEKRMHDYVMSVLAFAGSARLALHQGELNETHRQLARAMRARPAATYTLPFLAVRLRLQLAKVYLAIADPATARQLLREIGDILRQRPALGTFVAGADELRRVLASSAATGAIGIAPLTPAELRLLPYLQTYLSFRGIAERLIISPHTVKSESKSIYRKLGVSSRGDAVRLATAMGLLGA